MRRRILNILVKLAAKLELRMARNSDELELARYQKNSDELELARYQKILVKLAAKLDLAIMRMARNSDELELARYQKKTIMNKHIRLTP